MLALEEVEAELAANPPVSQPKKPLSDRSQMTSLQQVLAELAQEADV